MDDGSRPLETSPTRLNVLMGWRMDTRGVGRTADCGVQVPGRPDVDGLLWMQPGRMDSNLVGHARRAHLRFLPSSRFIISHA